MEVEARFHDPSFRRPWSRAAHRGRAVRGRSPEGRGGDLLLARRNVCASRVRIQEGEMVIDKCCFMKIPEASLMHVSEEEKCVEITPSDLELIECGVDLLKAKELRPKAEALLKRLESVERHEED